MMTQIGDILAGWTKGDTGLWVLLIVFGFLPSEIWRFISVFIARGLNEDAQILVWIRAVASTLLAGVVARLLLSPPGALASVPLGARLGAVALAMLVWYLTRRSVIAAVLAGEAVIVGAGYWFG